MPDLPSGAQGLSGTTVLGSQAVAVSGNNLGTINTGVIVNIHGDAIEKNVGVARAILAASLLAPPLDAQRKDSIARYYKGIATVLTGAARALRQGRVPHGKCGEMLSYAHQLPATIGDVIGLEQATALSQKLMESYQVESFGDQFMHLPPTEREAKFGALDAAAGYFRAAARSLQVRR